MRLPRFEYLEPDDLTQALDMLASHKEDVKIIAGGTDLLVRMKNQLLTPAFVMSMKQLSGLSYIKNHDDTLTIGAKTTLADIVDSDDIQEGYTALAQAAERVGAETIQHHRGTISGNILQDTRCIHYNQSRFHRSGRQPCHKDGGKICYARDEGDRCYSTYQGDMAPALIALEAKVVLSKKDGKRTINLSDLFTSDGFHPFSIEPDELLTEIILPKQKNNSKSAYQRLSYRSAIDYPITSAGVMINSKAEKIKKARIVVGSMSRAPLFMVKASETLAEKSLTDIDAFKEAAGIAMDNAGTFAVHNAGSTLEYRCDMTFVMVLKALEQAAGIEK
ncbi:MAG: hypothetical protein GY729_22050 [Desulfobacteraceae bacterium]|nr:hypothetical protein [Desulfobacteraceae bacterium]